MKKKNMQNKQKQLNKNVDEDRLALIIAAGMFFILTRKNRHTNTTPENTIDIQAVEICSYCKNSKEILCMKCAKPQKTLNT